MSRPASQFGGNKGFLARTPDGLVRDPHSWSAVLFESADEGWEFLTGGLGVTREQAAAAGYSVEEFSDSNVTPGEES